MLIYNVTVKTDPVIATEWIDWMTTEHIPEMIQTGCFTDARLSKLLEIDEQDGPTYSVQYFALDRADYDRYISTHAEQMRKKSIDKWGNKFIAFRSLMEVVN